MSTTRRFYLAGMSGTSHAAWRLAQAMAEHVAGVIGCVGGVQEETQAPPGEASFAYYGITSKIDFNHQETLRLEEHMLEAGIDHRIDVFEGRHGWSPHEHTNRALDWMELQAMKQGLAPRDDSFIEERYRYALSVVVAAEEPLERLRRHRDLVRDFEGFRDIGEHVAAVDELERSSELKAQRAQERKLARQERTYYVQRLGPFLAEINNPGRRPPTFKAAGVALRLEDLQERAANQEDSARAHSARRVLESVYTAIAFQLPGTFEARGDLERSARALEIAISIFPDRAAAHWRLASVYIRADRPEQAFEALRSATVLGNVDLERLKSDPTWEPLRGLREWEELLSSVDDG